jgi:transcriptional regulator with XRE-family HTH domain
MGLTRTAITKVENGTRRVDAVELSKFAELYQQPVAALSGELDAEPLPSNVQALARTASELSNKDREALLKFAHFLQGKPPEAE